MEQLFHAFGVDAKLIIIQIINFVALASILSYLLYKPVLKILSERENTIKQGLIDAESAAKAKENAEEEKREIVSAAHKEAGEVANRASSHAKENAAEIISEAEIKAAKTISVANEKAEVLKQQAIKESEAEVAKMAVLATEKLLKKS